MTASTAENISPWIEAAELPTATMIKCAAAAEHAAAQLRRSDRPAVVDLQPGNGNRYQMIIALLPQPELPGDMLIALPEYHASMLLASTGFHMPHYIDEKTRLGEQHSTVLAVFTTLLSDILARP